MTKTGAAKKIAVLVLVLILPGYLYYLLEAKGKNRYKPLPVFGPKVLAKTTHKVRGKRIPDTIYHTLPYFRLTDQTGAITDSSSFKNKIFIANFFYTRCPSVCRLMNSNMNILAENYAKNKMVYFVSITVDPEHDTTPVLNAYAAQFKPLPPKRLFLTGDTSAVYRLARNGFLVNAVKIGNDFIYSDKLVLVDEDKRIRGYYNGGSTVEVNRLNDEIKVLVAEELRKAEKPLY